MDLRYVEELVSTLAVEYTLVYKKEMKRRDSKVESPLDSKSPHALSVSTSLVSKSCHEDTSEHLLSVDNENEKLWILMDKKLSQKEYTLTWYEENGEKTYGN